MKKVITKALVSALIFALSTQNASAMYQLPRGFGVPTAAKPFNLGAKLEEEAGEALVAQNLSNTAAQQLQAAQAYADATQSLAIEEAAEAEMAAIGLGRKTADAIGQEAVATHAEVNQAMQKAPVWIRDMWNSLPPAEQAASIDLMEAMTQQKLSQ